MHVESTRSASKDALTHRLQKTLRLDCLGLKYRGYSVVDLAKGASFEEVVHLLLLGSLPTEQQLRYLKHTLYRARRLPPQLLQVLKQTPKDAHPMVKLGRPNATC